MQRYLTADFDRAMEIDLAVEDDKWVVHQGVDEDALMLFAEQMASRATALAAKEFTDALSQGAPMEEAEQAAQHMIMSSVIATYSIAWRMAKGMF